ncbi:4'-phosphopantetheinyl transferase [Arcicella aurantiaca]|uniref:4'-phosphopantetheinyl transferase n=1 Tax=Arcicella aurantiaca TaxID=591202 RepID=A0A316E2R5_9BACT|nr:4'-phosphopantetheinyl transferase superfamily protein [Arcicella aurantiaca]PWK23852.1 4'-phosphopantetheinyl transferase [Arcicella aurantiaca]
MLAIYYTQKSDVMTPLFWEWCRLQLPATIRDRIERKVSREKIQTSLLGYLLLKESFERNGLPQAIDMIKQSPTGRPNIVQDFDFNISHSAQYAVCAFSKKYSIGIDIEKIKPISLEFLQSFFNQDEWAELHQNENTQEQFYRLWTKKEAVVKADGRGLNIPLKEIIIRNNQGFVERAKWFLQEIPLDQNYMMHVATNEPISEYQRVKISFKG